MKKPNFEQFVNENEILIFIDEKIKRFLKPSFTNKELKKLNIFDDIKTMSEMEKEKEIYASLKNIDVIIIYNFYGIIILTHESYNEGIYQIVNNNSYTYFKDCKEFKYYDDL